MTTDSENPFWNFSLAVYGRAGVADSCLALQDRHGLDVNLLLLCCWAGAQGRALDSAEAARLTAAVEDWQRSVTRPLREVRRRLKALAGTGGRRLAALRREVKDCELAAERIAQDLLYDALPPGEPANPTATRQAACAASNLATYLELAGVPSGPEVRRDLEAILGGAFGPLPPQVAERWFPE